ncbi:mitochondrial proton/calcium exchanger protein-like protein isoform X1 [Tanacetum coccineum]
MTEIIEQYMSKTRGNYRSGVVRPKINDKNHFELKGKFLKELQENTFSGSEHEDTNEHIEKVLEIVDLLHIPEEVILFYNGLDVPTRQILYSKGAIPNKIVADAKIAIQEMAEYSQKWHNGTSSKARSTKTSDGLAAIQSQLKNLRREIKKVNKKVYAEQFGAPYQPKGQYRAARPRFYQHNNGNHSYPDRRQTLEESLTKFMAESTKRNEENSNIIKEIRASTDADIRYQGASIKTLEIQIGQMRKVLQERRIEGLPGSTEPNPRDHVKSISTAKANSSAIHHVGSGPYAVLDTQYSCLCSETIPFPSRLHGYYYDDWKEAREKDPGSFTLPCFIHDICFDKALVDLGASVSVIPFSIYSNLGLGNLAYTRLTIELADRTIKHLRGIAENVLARIDVFKRKITLRIGEEKLVFKSIKPATSIIRRVSMVKERTYLDSKTEFIGEAINESFDPLYGFSITDDVDITSGVMLGMSFCKQFVSSQKIMEKFAHGDEFKRMYE